MDYSRAQKAFWNKDKSARRTPDHPVVKAVYEPMAIFVASVVENPVETTVLDIGCGNGFLQFYLERHFQSVVGLDYSHAMLQGNPCALRVQGECASLPFADASFDVACASHMLHHLEEETKLNALKEMKRVARKGLVVFEPNRNNPLTFLFALLRSEERGALRSSKRYIRDLFSALSLEPDVQAHGWVVPNKSPAWSVGIGRMLDRTPLRKLGFDLWIRADLP